MASTEIEFSRDAVGSANGEAAEDTSTAFPQLRIAQLIYRDLEFCRCDSSGDSVGDDLPALIAQLPPAVTSADMRTRKVLSPPDAVAALLRTVASAQENDHDRLVAYAAACTSVQLAVSGPRGVATVTCYGRRVTVLDMEEDEDLSDGGESKMNVES